MGPRAESSTQHRLTRGARFQEGGASVFLAFMPTGNCKSMPYHFYFRDAVKAAGFELTFAYPSVDNNLLRVVFAVRPVTVRPDERVPFTSLLGVQFAQRFRWIPDQAAKFISVVPIKTPTDTAVALGHVGYHRLLQPFDPVKNPLDIGRTLPCLVTDMLCYKSFKRQVANEVAMLNRSDRDEFTRVLATRGVQLNVRHTHALPWEPKRMIVGTVSCLFQSKGGSIPSLMTRLETLTQELSATMSAVFATDNAYNALVHVALSSTRRPFELNEVYSSIKAATRHGLHAMLISCVPLDPNPKHTLVQAIVARKGMDPSCLLRELFPNAVAKLPAPTSPSGPLVPRRSVQLHTPTSPSGSLSPVPRRSPSPVPSVASGSGRAEEAYPDGPAFVPTSPSGPASPSSGASAPCVPNPVLDGLLDGALKDLNARYVNETPELLAEIDELRLMRPTWLKEGFFSHTQENLNSGKDVMRDAANTAYFMYSNPLFELAFKLGGTTDIFGYMIYTGKVQIKEMLEEVKGLKEMAQAVTSIARTLQTLPKNTLERFKDDSPKKRSSDGEGSARPAKVQRAASPALPRLIDLLVDPNPLKDAYISLMKVHTTLARMEPENPPYVDWDQAVSSLQEIRVCLQTCIDSVAKAAEMFPA